MRASGKESVNFGLVGYGGSEEFSEPHAFTMDGLLFGNSAKFQKAVNGLKLSTSASSDELALQALNFAAKYPFRVEVRKAIILLPCEACDDSTLYSTVYDQLFENDIVLNLFLQNPKRIFQINKSISRSVFGVDRSTVYTRKDFGSAIPVGDPSLRGQVSIPKDMCTALADVTGGALFNTRYMLEGIPQQKKKFTDVMSAVINKKLQKDERQECSCVPQLPGMQPLTVCSRVNREKNLLSIFGDLVDNFEYFNTA